MQAAATVGKQKTRDRVAFGHAALAHDARWTARTDPRSFHERATLRENALLKKHDAADAENAERCLYSYDPHPLIIGGDRPPPPPGWRSVGAGAAAGVSTDLQQRAIHTAPAALVTQRSAPLSADAPKCTYKCGSLSVATWCIGSEHAIPRPDDALHLVRPQRLAQHARASQV